MYTFVVVLVSDDGDANSKCLSVPQSSTELHQYSLNVSMMNNKFDVTVCYFQLLSISRWTSIVTLHVQKWFLDQIID
ncbi:hypothetical protein PILCRDRAFT_830244, partial [Piloderma croceum F 1598]